MPNTEIIIKRTRYDLGSMLWRDENDIVQTSITVDADSFEMVEAFAGLMLAMGYGAKSVKEALLNTAGEWVL